MNDSIHRHIASALLIAIAGAAGPVAATEGNGNSYALGVEAVYSGLMPPAGFHQFLYYQHYESTHNTDARGNDNSRLAYYKIQTDVVATRLSYVWPGVTLFGANVETRVAVSLPTIKLSLGIARPAPLGPLDRSGSATGLADPQIAPVLLGWHTGPLHQTAGVETFAPIGEYHVDHAVNPGRHYWQIAPIYAVTYLPDNGAPLDFKARYGINGRNHQTGYRSGNELTLEFSGGYRVLPHIVLGASGYYYRQLTDDRQNGAAVNGDGNRGKVTAIGPYFSYIFTPKFALLVKVQSEFGARNRPEGTRVWLQTKIPF